MSIYNYEQAFGAADKTTGAMRKAIQRWFAMYYESTATESSDPCQRIPYTVVNKLVRSVFGEYKAEADTSLGQSILEALDEKKRLAMQLALVGGSCYIKPCPAGTGFSFTLVPRNRALIFGADASGRPTDMGLVEKSVWGNAYYTLLERRSVDTLGYLTIQNKLYRSSDSRTLGGEVPLKNVPAYSGLAESYRFEKPVGSVGLVTMKMPMFNCVDGSNDGVAVYAPAEGLIRNIDRNEAQMNGEFQRGESRVFASRDLLDGEQGLQDHLFVGLDDDPERVGLTVFSPQLREGSFLARKQEYLRNLETLLGLRRGMISDTNMDDRTATEITASSMEYSLTVLDFQQIWQTAVEEVMALCGQLAELYGLPCRDLGKARFDWGNGVLYDQEKTWADYMEMVSKGILKPEVALAWRFGMADADEKTIQEKLMPN